MILKRRFHGLFDNQWTTLGSWVDTKVERTPKHIVTHSRRLTYAVGSHFHAYVPDLKSALLTGEVEGLQEMDTRSPQLDEPYFFQAYGAKLVSAPTDAEDQFGTEPVGVEAPGPRKDLDFDYQFGAYAVYNWEIFFHVPLMVAIHLSKNQRFADARKWFHYIFDPTDNSTGEAPKRYWKLQPFKDHDILDLEKQLLNLSTGADENLRDDMVAAIGTWRDTPFRPHAIARTRREAYMYRTVMAYLDNLIDWGDSLFRRDTPESINESLQHYMMAAEILGPRPQAVPKKGSIKPKTYAELRESVDEFGNAASELEAEIPFDLLGAGRPTESTASSEADAPMLSLGQSLYFCVPRNDKMLRYWDTVADRLFKIRNSINLDGVFRQLPLFAPPIDPGMMARATNAGVDVASIIAGSAAPLAPVRFGVLLQRALELSAKVESMGGQLLAAIEKRDGEALAILRANHETNLLDLAKGMRFAQWQEAVKNRESIQVSLANVLERYRHYHRLLGEAGELSSQPWEKFAPDWKVAPDGTFGEEPTIAPTTIDYDVVASSVGENQKMSSWEDYELEKQQEAQDLQDGAAAADTIASILRWIPQLGGKVSPFGIGLELTFGGEQIAQALQIGASIIRAVASHRTYEAGRAAKLGSYDRRTQDWKQQANSAAGEMTQLYKQLRAAEIREHIAKTEHANHLISHQQAVAAAAFLEDPKQKTTTEGFYVLMKREAQALYSRMFQFAFDVAKRAERAYQFETGDDAASFIQAGHMSGPQGMFAGEKLYSDLKRMDHAYLNANKRELELVKHIHLREWFPVQLDELRRTGKCQIELPEEIFDADCPGHCFRRIKSVAFSIPGVAGPEVGVHCSFTLTSSRIRRTPTGSPWYASDPNASDDRFVSWPVPVTSIVTSAAQNDTGMHETNLRDERYLPFEGAGAISTWALELLSAPRPFDYDTIQDVVLTIRYTARSGAARDAVAPEVVARLRQNAARAFSLRHDFHLEWARFKRPAPASPAGAAPPTANAHLRFALEEDDFPYWMRSELGTVNRLHVVVRHPASAKPRIKITMAGTVLGTAEVRDGNPVVFEATAFRPVGACEIEGDPATVDDVWLVFDWKPAGGGP
jgi:hypothetical protein